MISCAYRKFSNKPPADNENQGHETRRLIEIRRLLETGGKSNSNPLDPALIKIYLIEISTLNIKQQLHFIIGFMQSLNTNETLRFNWIPNPNPIITIEEIP